MLRANHHGPAPLRSLALASYLVVPLHARGRLLGKRNPPQKRSGFEIAAGS